MKMLPISKHTQTHVPKRRLLPPLRTYETNMVVTPLQKEMPKSRRDPVQTYERTTFMLKSYLTYSRR